MNRERFKKFEPSAETKSEIKTLKFWQGILAEFVAMVILVIVGCGAWVNNAETEDKAIEELNKSLPTVRIAISFGFTYAVLIYCLWDVSGGHINPAITLACLVCRKMHPLRGILFIVVHIFGAILGAALLHGLTPGLHSGNLGCTVPQDGVSPEKAFGVEFFTTLILVFAFFAAAEKRKENEERANLAPFIICFVIIAMHLFAVPYTGASMNTARSFGPAVVMGIFKHHWVYWFGPFVGGCIGGVLYDTCFSSGANVDRNFPSPPNFRKKKPDIEEGEGSATKREGEGDEAERQGLNEPTDIEEEKRKAQEQAAASQP